MSGNKMLTISEVSINFDNRTLNYVKGQNKVKSMILDEEEGLIKICYEHTSFKNYLIIPVVLLDSYSYSWVKVY